MARRRWVGGGNWQTLSHEHLDGVGAGPVLPVAAPAGRGPHAVLCEATGVDADPNDGYGVYRMGRSGHAPPPGEGLIWRAYLNFPAYPDRKVAFFSPMASSGARELRLQADGRLRIGSQASGTGDSAPMFIADDPLPLDTWLCFEIAIVPGPTGPGMWAARLDGELIWQQSNEAVAYLDDERAQVGIFPPSSTSVGYGFASGLVYVADCAIGDTDLDADRTWLGPGSVRALRPASGGYYGGDDGTSRFAATTWWHLPINRGEKNPEVALEAPCFQPVDSQAAATMGPPDPVAALNNTPPDPVGNEHGREPTSGGDGWDSHPDTQVASPADEYWRFYTAPQTVQDGIVCSPWVWVYEKITTPPAGEGIDLTLDSPADLGVGGGIAWAQAVTLAGTAALFPSTWPSAGKFGFWTDRTAKPAAAGDDGFFTLDDVGGTGPLGAGDWPDGWHVLVGPEERDVDVAALAASHLFFERLEASSAGVMLAGVGVNIEGDTSPQDEIPRGSLMALV